MRLKFTILTVLLSVLWLPALSAAQIPVPSGPVPFCFTQAPANPDSWQVSVDGGAFAPLTPAATKDTRCPAAATHSFTLPASLFTVGKHSAQLRTVNTFGFTDGPVYAVTVGIAPGAATIIAVLPPAPGGADDEDWE